MSDQLRPREFHNALDDLDGLVSNECLDRPSDPPLVSRLTLFRATAALVLDRFGDGADRHRSMLVEHAKNVLAVVLLRVKKPLEGRVRLLPRRIRAEEVEAVEPALDEIISVAISIVSVGDIVDGGRLGVGELGVE